MRKIKKLNVKLGTENSYPIYIGDNLLINFPSYINQFKNYSKIIIVTDKNVNRYYKKILFKFKKNLGEKLVVEIMSSGEKTKSFKSLAFLCENILKKKIDRNSLIICLGGGVIGDLVGLTSNLLLRGIDLVQIPTTLLSQVDSSVGGKTAINSKYGKNLIGTFKQPKSVIVSIDTLQTLKKREIFSGYAEILKYALIEDKKFFIWLKKNGKNLINLNQESLVYAILQSCKIKSKIVSKDEKEKGIREILNFGHTFGHAIESFTNFGKVTHGEAVIMGMYLALKFSVFLKFCKKIILDDFETHLNELKINYKLKDYKIKISPKTFIKHLWFDKKVNNKKLKFILIKDFGKTKSYIVKNETEILKFLKNDLT
jgi:3-dehydroquinate synthase